MVEAIRQIADLVEKKLLTSNAATFAVIQVVDAHLPEGHITAVPLALSGPGGNEVLEGNAFFSSAGSLETVLSQGETTFVLLCLLAKQAVGFSLARGRR